MHACMNAHLTEEPYSPAHFHADYTCGWVSYRCAHVRKHVRPFAGTCAQRLTWASALNKERAHVHAYLECQSSILNP